MIHICDVGGRPLGEHPTSRMHARIEDRYQMNDSGGRHGRSTRTDGIKDRSGIKIQTELAIKARLFLSNQNPGISPHPSVLNSR